MEELLYYTADTDLNRLLNRYVQESLCDNVSLSIDGIGLQNIKRYSRIYDVLSLTLESVYNSCLNDTITNNRYVKIRTMYQQNKIFIKILNSCEENCCLDVEGIEKIVKKDKGYFKNVNIVDQNQMYIALPMK